MRARGTCVPSQASFVFQEDQKSFQQDCDPTPLPLGRSEGDCECSTMFHSWPVVVERLPYNAKHLRQAKLGSLKTSNEDEHGRDVVNG